MSDVSCLAYVPDRFGVERSRYLLCEPDGTERELAAVDVGAHPSKLLTYDLSGLVDDLRRVGVAPPLNVFDIGDAVRLLVGKSKDDGGGRVGSVWARLKLWFDERADGESFERIAIGRDARPENVELSRLLRAALRALVLFWRDLRERLEHAGELSRLLEVEWPLHGLFAYRQFHGIRVDTARATELLARVSAEKYAAYRQVAEILNRNPTGLTFWNVGPYLSVTDVAELVTFEAGGRLQEAFEIVAFRSKFAAAFLSFVKAGRSEAIVRRALGEEQRLFPMFEVMGTVTGRVLVSDPFWQQLGRSHRSLILPDEGKRLVYLDYAQFEPGVLAGLADDDDFLQMYNDGDVYDALAIRLFADRAKRREAKRIFLAFLYGMSPERLASMVLGFSGAEDDQRKYAEEINRFFRAYPGLEAFRARQEAGLHAAGFVASAHGNRRVRVATGSLTPREKRWALNQPIQATAALIFKEALLKISEKYGPDDILLPMHDAILMQISDDEGADAKMADVKRLMTAAFVHRLPGVNVRITDSAFAE